MSPHRRGGLARNPLDMLVPDPTVSPVVPDPHHAPAPQPTPAPVEPPADAAPGADGAHPTDVPHKPVKFGGYIDPEIADHVRDTLVALGPEWTVGEFMEQAFLMFMHEKEIELNGGHPFPHRRRDKLRTGRRIG